MKGKTELTDEKSFEDIDNELIANGKFTSLDNLDEDTLNSAGLHCVKLKKNSRLLKKYQNILEERQYKYIYIGKTKHLKKRILEQLGINSSGAFFRNIGCALGYSAKKGYLKEKSSNTSFVFSKEDKERITEWLYENTEWSIVEYSGNRNVIKNHDMKLKELEECIKKCKEIAKL